MRPRYVEVKNFLGHEHEQVALPESGIFFLAGESGAGKSSFIVDALGFALFGSKATRVTRQEQLRHKDHQSEAMEVRALFEFDDGTQLTIARGLTAKGAPWAEVYEPNREHPTESLLLADTAHRVGRIIRKRLGGMTWQQFYAAFVARQSEISMLTTLKGAARKELVHRLLGMRELEKSTEETGSRLRTARVQLKGLQGQLGERTSESEDEQVQTLDAAAAEQERAAAAEQERLVKLRGQSQRAEAALEPYEQCARAHAEAERLRTSLGSRVLALAELNKNVERHRKALEVAAQTETLEGAVAALDDTVEQLRADYARSSEHRKSGEELAAADLRCAQLREQLAGSEDDGTAAQDLRSRQQLLEAERVRLGKERAERTGELQQLRESGVCFVCLRPLGEPHDHDLVLASIEAKLAELETAAAAANSELAEIAEQLPLAQQRARDRAANEQLLASATALAEQLRARQAELAASGEIVEDLEGLAAAGRTTAEELEQVRIQLAGAQAAAANTDSEVESQALALAALIAEEEAQLRQASAASEGFAEDTLDAQREAASRLRQEVAAAEGRAPELVKQAQSARAGHAAAVRERDSFADKLRALDEVRRQELRLEDLQTYLAGFQRKLAGDIRPALEEMGSEMLDQVSGGRHVSMRIDDSYEIEVQTAEGSWLPSVLLSGGELIRINICLRLALTRLVSQRTGTPARFLILDEPLPSQDPGHVQRIMELLDTLRSFYPQIYIISACRRSARRQ